MGWRQIPQTSPRAVMAREKVKPLTRIHLVQVRVGIKCTGSYPSRSRIISHRTFSDRRGYREGRGGNSFQSSH
jgi:hypothetical protein